MDTANTPPDAPPKYQLELNPLKRIPLLKAHAHAHAHPPPKPPTHLPVAKKSHTHPSDTSTSAHPPNTNKKTSASLYFIGTATTVLEWRGIRILTDPNFLHAGDHVHLGPGVTAKRLTNPAVDLDALPPLDCILLSHYHADHFDQLVEASLNRQFPIISTPHAKKELTNKPDAFQAVYDLDFFESMMLPVVLPPGVEGMAGKPVVKVTGMPGKHVPPGILSMANDVAGAVPPTNGWMLELGSVAEGGAAPGEVETGCRIYISGDTLFVDELKEIPKWLKNEKIDLMLVHLGGTTIPGPSLPLLMVTMDAKQGVQLMQLMDPEVTVPIHFDDYDVFLSPLGDFKEEVEKAGWGKRVVYLDRGDEYRFAVRGE